MALDLDTLRTTKLNPALGLASDLDALPWGDATVRHRALVVAVRRLWPHMARLLREDLEVAAGVDEYELSYIWDVEAIQVLGTEGRVLKEIRNYRNFVDHSDDGDPYDARRIQLPIYWEAGSTDALRVVGYAPFDVYDSGGGST